MSFSKLELKISYSSPEDDIVNDFLIPALKEAVLYERASAYFSSLSLLDLVIGIKELYEKNGKIRLIISPQIKEDDAEAIVNGLKMSKDPTLEVKLLLEKSFREADGPVEAQRYNILSHLIAANVLEIKVAVLKSNPRIGIFHDKTGIIEDENGNLITFSGSMNETRNGMMINHENIDVFSSLSVDFKRAIDKKDRFERQWNNEDSTLDVFPFPENLKKKIDSYYSETIDWSVTNPEPEKEEPPKRIRKNQPYLPEEIKLRDYQIEAIDKWEQAGYRGFYDMATGTGKTITALASIVRLFEHHQGKLAIVIVVPYIHLVTQWQKDLDRFGIQAIAGFSGRGNSNWKYEFEKEVNKFNWGLRKYICLITTNASFRLPTSAKLIGGIKGEILLVVDEAHNFKAPSLLKQLDDRFKYRLALSATLGDERDEIVQKISDYFSPVCIEYSLEKAISEGMLCEYLYYPVAVHLTEEEQEQYDELSIKISRLIERDKNGKPKYDSTGKVKFKPEAKFLLIKRAQIIAGAANKLEKLKEVLKGLDKKDHLLVYCGTTSLNADESDYSDPDKQEIRQIEAAKAILQNDFDIRTASYTSQEPLGERELIAKRFDQGDLEAITAIRCLDEGVDIPSIRQAIILASSTNPKEYIQRRGRILRKYPGKETALLIDMVTLPSEERGSWGNSIGEYDTGLVQRELRRVQEFGRSALNKHDSDRFTQELNEQYELSNTEKKYREDDEHD